MDRFVLLKSDEEIEKEKREDYNYLVSNGVKESIARHVLESECSFLGIRNRFPKLTEEELTKIEDLFKRREEILKRYIELSEILKPIMEERRNLSSVLYQINNDICSIEGHRLSEDIDPIPGNEYGIHSISRTCLVCGKSISEYDIDKKDTVVKSEIEPYQRILFRTSIK